MQIDIEDRSGVKVLRPHGELGSDQAHDFLETAVGALADHGTRMIVDLSDVSFISSAGLTELVRVAAQVNTQEGRLILAAVTPFVEGVLQATNLVRFFDMTGSVDEALRMLG